MKPAITEIAKGLERLFFPHTCAGCGRDLFTTKQLICLSCQHRLPVTRFHLHAGNPAEKIFWGRIPVTAAASFLYFTKNSVLQHLLHQLKYNGNREAGFFLGKQMGLAFIESDRFRLVDALVPLPLFPARLKKRGYNQAAVIAEGFSAAAGIPVYEDVIRRNQETSTQTHKNRIERWQNMAGRFEITNEKKLAGKKIVLIDDVLTTGATLEACGMELLKAKGLVLNIATLAYTSV